MSATSISRPRQHPRRAARVPRKTPIDLTSPPPPPDPAPEGTVAAAVEGLMSLSAPSIGGGAAATAIDVEAIEDDDVLLLPSSRGFPQRRNQARRRNRPVVVVIDDDERESHSQESVTSRLDHSLKRTRTQPKPIIINCESSSTSKGERIPALQKEPVPKEPSFGCPICLNPIENLCSTICGHIFCETCLNNAVRVQKKCPTCRGKLTNKGFHRVFLTGTIKD